MDMEPARLGREEFQAHVLAMERGMDLRVASIDERMTGLEGRIEARIVGLEGRIEARIVGLEERIEARIAGLEGRIAGLEGRIVARIAGLEGRVDARIAGLEGRIEAHMAASSERDRRIELIATSVAESAKEARSLKSNMWLAVLTVMLTVVATTFASYFASRQSNLAIVQAVQSSYQQGRVHAAPPGSLP